MPHMPTVVEPDKTDREVITYVHRRGSNVRLQLDAADDERDVRGRTIRRGYSKHAHFDKGLFTTNIAELQDGIEDSIAFKSFDVARSDVLEQRALDKQLESLMETAKGNPELAKQLRSRLAKMASAASAKAEKGIPTGRIETVEEE